MLQMYVLSASLTYDLYCLIKQDMNSEGKVLKMYTLL